MSLKGSVWKHRSGLCRAPAKQSHGEREPCCVRTDGVGREAATVATEREGQPLRQVWPGLGRAVTKSRAKLKELRHFLKGSRSWG